MAAVIAPSPIPRPEAVGHPSQPALRVIPGGSEAVLRRRQPRAVYRRRRLAVGLALVLLVILGGLAAVGAAELLRGAGARPAPGTVDPASVTAGSGSPVDGSATVGATRVGVPSARVHVVAPGDTLWSIASRLDPGGDPRPLVDALADRVGGPELRVGQRIPLDGLVD